MTKEQLLQAAKENKFQPLNQSILCLVDAVKETTKTGIVKSKEQIEEEKKDFTFFLDVVATSSEPQVTSAIEVGDKVLPTRRDGSVLFLPFLPAPEGKIFVRIKFYDVEGVEKR